MAPVLWLWLAIGCGESDPGNGGTGGATTKGGAGGSGNKGGAGGSGGSTAGTAGTTGHRVGDSCRSGSGVVVGSRNDCFRDDAFCEDLGDGTFCTGGLIPQPCPPGTHRSLPGAACIPDMVNGGAGGVDGAGGDTSNTAGLSGGGTHGGTDSDCVGPSGLPGKIVEDQTDCYLDDAFCVARSDGTWCTGGQPFICPPGQIRIDWGTCGSAGGAGAGGDGGSENGGASFAGAGGEEAGGTAGTTH
ncbi:MAG TPA: hypothetical protein VFQ61_00060 [Polyangiaceae bacterium]|nr:hypothetical protein [Polyangiaceae bacterium]